MLKGFARYQLADRVLEALPAIGFKTPTEVQEQVIPLILQRRNVLVEAATGTGKTAAYGLPLLTRIDYTKRSTQVLVLVPSRELALQVETALRSFTTHEKFRVASVYGGMSLADSEKKVKSSPHVLVAVPGRLKDALRGGKLDHFWRDIKYLVIDEADKLMELGFQDILDNLVSNVRNMVQVALFSATISEDVEAMIKERFAPLQIIRLSPKEALHNIIFNYIVVDQGQKQRYLASLIQTQGVRQALIFTPNRDEVYDLANFLRSVGLKAEAYHGLLDQVERAAVMKRFKHKQVNFLVATDLAARGLDVHALPAVINYAFPEDIEVYLHRCGRTGRAGRRGAVYNLVASKKEEILVESFHGQLQIPLKGFMIEPIDKNAVKHATDKLIKVHVNRGKRDKISAGDIVGFLVGHTGVVARDIGTVAVYDSYTLVNVHDWVLETLELQEDLKIKGKGVKVTRYTLDDQKNRAEALKKSRLGVADKRKLEETAQRRARAKAKAEEIEDDDMDLDMPKARKGSKGEAGRKEKPAAKEGAVRKERSAGKESGRGKADAGKSGKGSQSAKPGKDATKKPTAKKDAPKKKESTARGAKDGAKARSSKPASGGKRPAGGKP
ncbi:MAG: DEAD/DEAH box helicase [Bacteroidia bacterium]